MPNLPEIRIPMPEEEQPLTLYARITNTDEPPKYDDIQNSNLPTDEKIRQMQYRTQAYQNEVDRQKEKDLARIRGGSLLSMASFLPMRFLPPVVGTGVGGAMYDVGQGIVEGEKLPELEQRANRGFVIGAGVGMIPGAGQYLANSKAGQAVLNTAPVKAVGNAFNKVGERFTNSKLYDALMTDIKGFNPNKQTVYHGSPYDFKKFSNEAIGTGEGAQAHGRGHYSALEKNVADERYRKRLGNETILYKGESPKYIEFKNGMNNAQLLDAILYRGKNGVLKHLETNRPFGAQTDELINYVKSINEKELKKQTQGQLYKLSIPKDDVMLREDVLMKEQPNFAQLWDDVRAERLLQDTSSLPKFKMALGANDIDINKTFGTKYYNEALEMAKNNPELYKDLILRNYTGRDLYDYLIRKLGNAKAANEYLQQRGIKGISYNGGIDGEARVIFNPEDIEIIRKYYNQPSLYEQITGKQNVGANSSGLYEYLNNPKANPKYEQELQKLYNPPLDVDPNTLRAYIGDISDNEFNLGLQNGYDLTGFQHILDNSAFNHFRNNHYGINEIDNRLIPLSDNDIRNIPNVIYTPDNIEFLPKTVRKLPRIKYTKNTENGKQIYVEQIQNKKKRLNTKTMWKEK